MRGTHEHNGPRALVDAIFTRPTPKRGAMHLRRKKEMIADRSTCENCAIILPAASMLHMHHTVPVSRGGSDGFDNLILLCPNCHAIAHWLDRQIDASKRPRDRHELQALMAEQRQKACA